MSAYSSSYRLSFFIWARENIYFAWGELWLKNNVNGNIERETIRTPMWLRIDKLFIENLRANIENEINVFIYIVRIFND